MWFHWRRVCRVVGLNRTTVRRVARAPGARRRRVAPELLTRLASLIHQHPTFGYRRLWALLRFHQGHRITPKTVYGILKLQGWFVHQRTVTPRPRVQGRRSQAARSNERWATDVTHVDCGADGWAHLAAVIECHDREIVGYELPGEGPGKAERALERPAWRALGRCVPPPGRRPSSAPTMGSSISGRPVGTIGCSRSSSRRIHASRTGSSSASSGA